MAANSNPLAPTGFGFARNFLSGSNTYGQQQLSILNGYGTNIYVGDPVIMNANGTINLAGTATFTYLTTGILGFFAGVLPYYDTTLQGIGHGVNGAYISSIAPPSGVNVPCMVITDPYATFLAQVSAASTAFTQSWVGQNCTWIQSSVGVGNGAGRSIAVIDTVTNAIGTSNTFPLRIIGPAGVTGGPQDPANNNPWIEVRMNLSLAQQPLGV